MTYVVKISTLNINGIVSKTRIGMLEDFLRRQDIDLALLQEVTRADLTTFRRYTAHTNTGTDRRGMVILVKEELVLSDIRCIPSGRGMAASYNGIWIINLYAPSGAEKRNAQETFYNTEITSLLPSTEKEMIVAGDFNCVLLSTDTTRRGNYSRALDSLTKGLNLKDVWKTSHMRPTFTHYTPTGASRLDRIYVTENLRKKKKEWRRWWPHSQTI
jgi:exonuclease III